jgi:hypothetical protein
MGISAPNPWLPPDLNLTADYSRPFIHPNPVKREGNVSERGDLCRSLYPDLKRQASPFLKSHTLISKLLSLPMSLIRESQVKTAGLYRVWMEHRLTRLMIMGGANDDLVGPKSCEKKFGEIRNMGMATPGE